MRALLIWVKAAIHAPRMKKAFDSSVIVQSLTVQPVLITG